MDGYDKEPWPLYLYLLDLCTEALGRVPSAEELGVFIMGTRFGVAQLLIARECPGERPAVADVRARAVKQSAYVRSRNAVKQLTSAGLVRSASSPTRLP